MREINTPIYNSFMNCRHISNRLNQSYHLISYLFNIYIDDLINGLNACTIGYILGDELISHLMYAEDVVHLWLYCGSFAILPTIGSHKYDIENNVLYNLTKS